MIPKGKKCKNDECVNLIDNSQNPKKLFCSINCKNRFHYLENKKGNFEFEQYQNDLKLNYAIIMHFLNKNIFKIKDEIAKSLGFKTNVYMSVERLVKGEKQYKSFKRIKDVFFRYNMLEEEIEFCDWERLIKIYKP